MRLISIRTAVVFALLACFPATPLVWADSNSEVEQGLEEMRKDLEELRKTLQAQDDVIQKQQARIAELERKMVSQAQAEVPKPTAPAPSPAKGVTLPGQIGAILPEIGVVGDLVATATENKADAEGNNRLAVRELELVLGNYVDPYSRYDATIAFSDFEAVDVEEAYLTHWGIPWGLKARLGRFFPRIGKAASIHRDSLSTIDEPLVIRRYFGSHGYFRTGADLTRPFAGPWGMVLEPSVGILEGGVGEGGGTFGSTRKRPTVYSHLKTFKELTDASHVELGLTHLVGSKDADAAFEVNVLGVDATYLNALTPNTKLKLQGEFYLQHRNDAFSIDATTGANTQFDRHPWGVYLLADYRFAPQWSVGGRFDHARLIDTAGSRHADQGLSAFLTFYQSEWARWRLQYRHEDKGAEKSEDAVFLQGTFAIGTHKHQIQ